MNLGAAIRELRKSKSFSQVELAKKANITQTTLSKIEKGQRPNDETLGSVANALNVPISLLLIMSIEKADVPAKKQELFDKLFPVIKTMVLQISGDE